jgi:hypothetical protein
LRCTIMSPSATRLDQGSPIDDVTLHESRRRSSDTNSFVLPSTDGSAPPNCGRTKKTTRPDPEIRRARSRIGVAMIEMARHATVIAEGLLGKPLAGMTQPRLRPNCCTVGSGSVTLWPRLTSCIQIWRTAAGHGIASLTHQKMSGRGQCAQSRVTDGVNSRRRYLPTLLPRFPPLFPLFERLPCSNFATVL